MSASLHWRPVPKTPEENDLPPELRYALTKNSMGSEYDFFHGGARYGKEDLKYFYGLRDGGVEGANEIIGLISLHGTVELYLE